MEKEFDKFRELVERYICRLKGDLLEYTRDHAETEIKNKQIELERIPFYDTYGGFKRAIEETVSAVEDVLCAQDHSGMRRVLNQLDRIENDIRNQIKTIRMLADVNVEVESK